MKTFDVIIIGGGIIGSYSLYRLAKQGVTNCLLIDKAPAPGQGATGSWGSLLRAMHRSTVTTRKACRALPEFERLFLDLGDHCKFNKTGSLYFLKRSELHEVQSELASLREHQISFDVVNSADGRRFFPHFNWFEDDVAIFEKDSGTTCPTAITAQLIGYAKRAGAQTIFGDEVSEINLDGKRVASIETKSGLKLSCAELVTAAGVWTKTLLDKIKISVDTFDRVIQINRFCRNHFEAQIPLFIDRNHKSFGHFFADGSFAGGTSTVDAIVSCTTSSCRLSISDANIAKMTIAKRLNWLKNASLEGGIRAREAYTHDGQGIVSNQLGITNLIVATGFSCTGFILSPLISEKIVDLILATKRVR